MTEAKDHFINTERVAMMIIAIVPTIIMITLNVLILFVYTTYSQKSSRKLPKFKTTTVFIVLTMLFYVNFCLRAVNLCYGDFKHEQWYILSSLPLYGGHFLFFMLLLFDRLNLIFNSTQYQLNKSTMKFFYFLVAFGLVDSMLWALTYIFVFPPVCGPIFYYVGTAAIVLAYIWISLLYIIKLFKVITDFSSTSNNSKMSLPSASNSETSSTMSEDRKHSNANRRILQSITKYTLLNAISVVTNITFWYVGFIVRSWPKGFKRLFIFFIFWQLSISVNIIAFALGFHFSSPLYWRFCSKMDNLCKSCFEKMVYCVIQRNVTKSSIDVANIELEIQEQSNTNTKPTTTSQTVEK